MTAIVTITLNPAVDLSTWVEKILPIFKLRCTSPHRNPGGGGINVARVIRRFGADVTAIYPIGGKTGDLLRKLLDAEAVVSQTFPILGETAKISSSENQHRPALPFYSAGPKLDENEWQGMRS
jgi:6-phosphofructokinase 2